MIKKVIIIAITGTIIGAAGASVYKIQRDIHTQTVLKEQEEERRQELIAEAAREVVARHLRAEQDWKDHQDQVAKTNKALRDQGIYTLQDQIRQDQEDAKKQHDNPDNTPMSAFIK